MSASALLGVRVGDRVGGGLGGGVGGGVDESVGGRVDGAPCNAEVRMSPELLADLYEPHLIISADYVGPDPRYVEWDRPRREAAAGAPLRHAFSDRMLEILAVVLVTVAVVVPITLVASQGVRGAPSPQPTTRIVSAPPSSAPPSSAPHATPVGRSANPTSPNSSGATPVAAGAATGASAQGANDRRAERAQSAADRRAERIARHAARARWHVSSAMAALAGH
jgi:hypothetical protein